MNLIEIANLIDERKFELAQKKLSSAKVNTAEVLLLKSLLSYKKGNLNDALVLCHQSIKKNSKSINTKVLNALILQAMGDFESAINIYEQILKLDKCNDAVIQNLVNCLNTNGEYERAEAIAQYGLSINVKNQGLWINYGNSKKALKKFDEALQAYELAKKISTENEIGCITNIASTYYEMGDFAKSIKTLSDYSNVGIENFGYCAILNLIHQQLGDYQKAIYWGSLAKKIKSDINLFLGLSYAYRKMGDNAQSQAIILEMEKIFGDTVESCAGILQYSISQCDFSRRAVYSKMLNNYYRASDLNFTRANESPFFNLMWCQDEQINIKVAKTYAARRYGASKSLKNSDSIYKNSDPIKIGLYGADFYNHATMHLLEDWIREIDKSKFKLFFYSYGPSDQSGYRELCIENSEKYYDLLGASDEKIIEAIKSDNINILIDLKGHTEMSRLSIFKSRIANIHATWLGYPGSLGMNEFDYIFADSIVIPDESKKFYAEKVFYIDTCYQATSYRKVESQHENYRVVNELAKDTFIFGSFNQLYKITDEILDEWIKILLSTPNSLLMIYENSAIAIENIIRKFISAGVNEDRLIIEGKVEKTQHLMRMSACDLMLDTTHCNGHTTTTDALMAGLPVITVKGNSFSSRVSESVLNAAGLKDLVFNNLKEYSNFAISMCNDESLRITIKSRMKGISTSYLFDTKQRIKNVEESLTQLMESYALHQ